MTTRTIEHSLTIMRQNAPLVQNITNFVAMNITANALLAAGASPAMAHARAEAAEFAGLAQALSVNIGTPDPEWGLAMEEAAEVMVAAGKPWVLDPVAVGATAFRRALGARLVTLRPTVIRGNASEILALSGAAFAGKGVDTTNTVTAAEAAARDLALTACTVVAVTGQVDFVTDGIHEAHIANGHPMMPQVTALGCALTGVVAAFCDRQDIFEATVAALAYFGVAGEVAAETAVGPGSFQVSFLDALYNLTPAELARRAKVDFA